MDFLVVHCAVILFEYERQPATCPEGSFLNFSQPHGPHLAFVCGMNSFSEFFQKGKSGVSSSTTGIPDFLFPLAGKSGVSSSTSGIPVSKVCLLCGSPLLSSIKPVPSEIY